MAMRFVTLLALLASASASAVADTVRLRDGRELTGYVIDANNRSVTIAGSDGVPVQVVRSEVEWIAYVGDDRARRMWRQTLLPSRPAASAVQRPKAPTGNRGYLSRSDADARAPRASSIRRPDR